MIILVHSLKKGNKELMAQFNLNQTYSFVRKLHQLTLPEYRCKPKIYQELFGKILCYEYNKIRSQKVGMLNEKNDNRKIDEESLQLYVLFMEAREILMEQIGNFELLECEKS